MPWQMARFPDNGKKIQDSISPPIDRFQFELFWYQRFSLFLVPANGIRISVTCNVYIEKFDLSSKIDSNVYSPSRKRIFEYIFDFVLPFFSLSLSLLTIIHVFIYLFVLEAIIKFCFREREREREEEGESKIIRFYFNMKWNPMI